MIDWFRESETFKEQKKREKVKQNKAADGKLCKSSPQLALLSVLRIFVSLLRLLGRRDTALSRKSI